MATFRKVYWTQDEFNRVAGLFGPEYEKAERTMQGLRESLIFAQAILPSHRQRPVDGPASSIYNIRSQLLAVYAQQKKSKEQEFQQSLGLLVSSAPVSAKVIKSPALVTVQTLGHRDSPLKGLPSAGEKLVAIQSATPPPATDEIPMSPMSKIVAQVVERTLQAVIPTLLQEMEDRFDKKLQDALAQQKKELFDFWGGPSEEALPSVSVPSDIKPAEIPVLPTVHLGFKSLEAAPAKKPRVLVFGALDSQRRAYQEALPGCDIEVSKDKFKVEHLGGYDLVIVLRDFVPADLRRIIEKNGKDVRLVTGAVAKTVDQIKQALHH